MKQPTQLVGLGAPPVPLVPAAHFTKFDSEVIRDAWQIVGPSVARNFGNFRPVPLWCIFAACYAEGVNHGAELTREKLHGDPTWMPPLRIAP